MSSIYSIGHGHKTREQFVAELQARGIAFLIDVRSNPYSKWSPEYNREYLEQWLREVGIRYVYWGDTLGGKPKTDDCYTLEGYYDYAKMAQQDMFIEGLERLAYANKQDIKVAVMCTEANPCDCHRSKLIGRELYLMGLYMQHIVGITEDRSQEEVMMALDKGWHPDDMFNPVPPTFHSRKAYRDLNEDTEGYD